MKSEILLPIREAKNILIMTHLRPDGDAVGSSFALARGLIQSGKSVRVLSVDPLPYDVAFLSGDGFLVHRLDPDFKKDLVISLDCSDPGRLKDRQEHLEGPILNIDHHRTNTGFGTWNWVDPEASATGEMVYRLLKALEIALTTEIAQDLYVAIATDTGQFMYSNTTAKTHAVIAELMDIGIDAPEICRRLYQSIPLEKFQLDRSVMGDAEFLHGGRFGLAVAPAAVQMEFGCDNTDGLVESLRNIEGVEVACLLVERDDAVKVSLRSKGQHDVSATSVKHGGGGHRNAAGFSIDRDLKTVRDMMKKEFEWLEKRHD